MREIKYEEIDKELTEKKVLVNIFFSLNNFSKIKRVSLSPSKEDEEERDYIISRAEEMVIKLTNQTTQRKACFPLEKYGFSKCPSLFHVFIENNKLNLNVYFRSWNYLKNFDYDTTSCILFIEKILEEGEFLFKENNMDVSLGEITFIVNNFHLKT